MPLNEQKNILFDFLAQPRLRIWRHILIIIIFSFVSAGQSLFVFGDQAEALGGRIYWFGIGNMVITIAFFYLNLYFLVPRLLLKDKYMEYLFTLLGGTIIYLIIKGVIESGILLNLGIVRSFNLVTILDGLSNLTLYAICIASSSGTILLRQWVSDTEKINDLENNRLKNSLDEIKSHINTRLLSNVLNYASDQVKTDSDKVSDILFRLSEVLRYELYDCKREMVLLKSDIEFIDKYLSLEQLNHRNSFTYSISAMDGTTLFVPPSIFIAVIKRISGQQPTGMQIDFNIQDGVVKFLCKVQGTDLTKCDFSKEEQRFSADYPDKIRMNKGTDFIELRLNT